MNDVTSVTIKTLEEKKEWFRNGSFFKREEGEKIKSAIIKF